MTDTPPKWFECSVCKNQRFRIEELNIDPRPTLVYFIVCDSCGARNGTYEKGILDLLYEMKEKLDRL